MIEGHTDNVPYHGNQFIEDNWDLSVKRATTVVRELLKNKKINPKRFIAAGRSKYHPVAPNDTPQNRAKNRRIEVILTPNMNKIQKLLQQ
jgi:chemotaxis protein MotB